MRRGKDQSLNFHNSNDGTNLKTKKGKKLKVVLLALFALILIVCIAVGPTVKRAYDEAEEIKDYITEDTFERTIRSEVYDVNGKEINVFGINYYVKKEDCEKNPKTWEYALHATIDVVDKNFESHNGVELSSIIKKEYSIEQKLIKQVILEDEASKGNLEDKLEEIFLAKDLDKQFSKDKIMEFYLNNINYSNVCGINGASMYYYGKKLSELNLAQIAYISVIPTYQAAYNPYSEDCDLDKAGYNSKTKDRMKFVLEQMLECESITKGEYEEALAFDVEKTLLGKEKSEDTNTPNISYYVKNYIEKCAIDTLCEKLGNMSRPYASAYDDYSAYENDIEKYSELYRIYESKLLSNKYNIYTSIDLDKQEELQQAIDKELNNVSVQTIKEKRKENGIEANDTGDIEYAFQGAGVCIENSENTAYVTAIVGGRSNTENKVTGNGVNRAYKSFRQPGTAFSSLVVYGPAFDTKKYDIDTIVEDKDYASDKVPKNIDGKYKGKITVKQAVGELSNIVPWNMFADIGETETAWKYLSKMSFAILNKDKEDSGASMALGGLKNGVSSLEMAGAYSMIQRGGVYYTPTCVKSIKTPDGTEIDSKQKGIVVYNPDTCKKLTECLQETFKSETVSKHILKNNWNSAGRAGTTNSYSDGWFVGYTPKYTTAIWCGYDDNSSGENIKMVDGSSQSLKGDTFPLNIWEDYMNNIHKKLGDGSSEALR